MATGSIYTNINIKGKKAVARFVAAVENAQGKSSKHVVQTKLYTEVKGEDVKKLFGDNE